MITLGLTGSIGMGKSTTARLFQEAGARVHDADAVVHDLYAVGGAAVPLIAAAFPGAVVDGAVDRPRLSALLQTDPEGFARLNALVHPLVSANRDQFLAEAEGDGASVAVLDLPLLFETGLQDQVDAVVVVSAPESVQQERVLARPGMTLQKWAVIQARQTPDSDKRAQADFVIDTGQGLEAARDQVRAVMSAVTIPGWVGRRGPA